MRMTLQQLRSQTDHPHRSQRLRFVAGGVPVALLVVVAATQMYLSASQNLLTPSKGGGFGMFATVDKLKTRLLRVFVIDSAGRSRPVRLDSRVWKQTLRHVRALPTQQQLRRIARHVAKAHPHAHTVWVSVWKRGFDAASRQTELRAVQELLWEPRRDAKY